MLAKLTLSIKKDVIEKAKRYAKTQGRSLSNIIEEYLKSISSKSGTIKQEELSSILEELRGSIKQPKNLKSYDKILEKALVEKYVNK